MICWREGEKEKDVCDPAQISLWEHRAPKEKTCLKEAV